MGRRYIIKSKKGAYVERDRHGRFKNWSSRSRSAMADRRTKARTRVKPGYGHQGDQAHPYDMLAFKMRKAKLI